MTTPPEPPPTGPPSGFGLPTADGRPPVPLPAGAASPSGPARVSTLRTSKVRSGLLTALLVVTCAFLSIAYDSFGSIDLRFEPLAGASPHYILWQGLGLFVAPLLAVSLIWRGRFALWIAIVNLALTILLPIDASVALVAAATGVHHLPKREAAITVGAATAATAVAFGKDAARPAWASLWGLAANSGQSETITYLPSWGIWTATFTILAVGIAVLIGWAWRQRETVAIVRADEAREAQHVEQLDAELFRAEERAAIASEVHDEIGRDLTHVSLLASELEATSSDPATAQAAEKVYASATAAVDKLARLVEVIRNPQARGIVTQSPPPTADSVDTLVSEAIASGVPLAAIIRTPSESLPAPLGAAAYRICQEALTNAEKHAPGQLIRLELRATADEGVVIRVWNALPDVPGTTSGGQHGILGMRERAEALGGTLTAGVDTGQPPGFEVVATLPWPRTPQS